LTHSIGEIKAPERASREPDLVQQLLERRRIYEPRPADVLAANADLMHAMKTLDARGRIASTVLPGNTPQAVVRGTKKRPETLPPAR
jgi:hypothetical protein